MSWLPALLGRRTGAFLINDLGRLNNYRDLHGAVSASGSTTVAVADENTMPGPSTDRTNSQVQSHRREEPGIARTPWPEPWTGHDSLRCRGPKIFPSPAQLFPGRPRPSDPGCRKSVCGHLGAQHAHVVRRLDAHSDRLPFDLQNGDRDLGADLNLLLGLASEHEHGKHSFVLRGEPSRCDSGGVLKHPLCQSPRKSLGRLQAIDGSAVAKSGDELVRTGVVYRFTKAVTNRRSVTYVSRLRMLVAAHPRRS